MFIVSVAAHFRVCYTVERIGTTVYSPCNARFRACFTVEKKTKQKNHKTTTNNQTSKNIKNIVHIPWNACFRTCFTVERKGTTACIPWTQLSLCGAIQIFDIVVTFHNVRGFWGEGSTICSPPCACLPPLIGARLTPTYSTLYTRISPQWLADWDDCGRVLPVKMRVNSFPTLCLVSIVSPIRLPWVKDVRVFRCNFPPILLTEWTGSCKVPLRYHGAGTDTE